MLVASIKEAKFKDAEPVWSPASLFLALFEDLNEKIFGNIKNSLYLCDIKTILL